MIGNGRNENRLGNATGRLAMLGHVARNFTAAGGVTDVNGVLQVQRFNDREGVGRVVVHVVTFRNLCRAAMTASVMRYDTVALGKEEQHLRIPIVRRERPAVMEDDWLCVLWTPVFVEDFSAVLGRYECAAHGMISY